MPPVWQVSPEGQRAVRRLSHTLRVVRPPLLVLLLLHALLPANAFAWLPRLVAWLLRGACRLLRLSPARLERLERAQRLVIVLSARLVLLAEVAHGFACLALVPAIVGAVVDAIGRLGVGPTRAFCPDPAQPLFANDSLCGDPYTLSRTFFALLLVYAGMVVDRSVVVLASAEGRLFKLPRAGPVVDALTLLLLLAEASPLAVPFAAHVSVDSCLQRFASSSQRAGQPQMAQAAGNARAAAGAALSLCMLGFATASAQPWCGGKREPAALVIAARLFSLLADLVDLAHRVHIQARLARRLAKAE